MHTPWSTDSLANCHAVFRMAAVRHVGFLKFNFVTSDRLRDPFCISVPDFVKIGQTVAEISRFL